MPRLLRLLAACLACILLLACTRAQPFANNNVTGHLPDLDFTLTGDNGAPLHGRDLRGKVVLAYFGFTHCPDVCPLTLTQLHAVLQQLGTDAEGVRILFVSVDPRRDTPDILHAYVRAFDPRAIGATGTPRALRAVAKRYRVAFELKRPDANGNYDVSHSSAVFVFDREGRARVLARSAENTAALAHDIRLLLEESP